MEIRYTDLHGKALTSQEVFINKFYRKIFEENNRLRKVEYYEDNVINDTFYYIEYRSSHQQLLALNQNTLKVIEIEDLDINYTKHRSFKYHNGILESKGIEICNAEGYLIMTQDLDMETNLPLYNKTYKYFNDNNYEFEFQYHSSGDLISILVSNPNISFYEQYRFSDLGLIPYFDWWQQYSLYYLHAEPSVPNCI